MKNETEEQRLTLDRENYLGGAIQTSANREGR